MTERPPISHIERERQEPEPSSLELVLRDSIADRHKVQAVDTPELLPSLVPSEVENLTEEEHGIAEKNAALLKLLNGHQGQDLRTIAVHGKSFEAQYLSELLSWSKEVAEGRTVDLRGLVSIAPPAHFDEHMNAEQIYERLCIYEKYPTISREDFGSEQMKKTAEALHVEGEDVKWVDMIDAAFPADDAKAAVGSLLDRVGAIPTELLTKRKFRGLRGERVAGVLHVLAEIERDEEMNMTKALGEISGNTKTKRMHLDEAALARERMEQARHERAKVLNHFFIGRNAEQLRRKNVKNITLDSNGLFIQLRGFQSHIPYGLVTEEMAESLKDRGWIDEVSLHEIQLRTAEENTDLRGQKKESDAQLLQFAEILHTKGTPEEVASRFAREVLEHPEEFAKLLSHNNLVMPDSLIAALSEKGKEGISALMTVAEWIGAGVTNEELGKNAGGFATYDLLHRTEDAYSSRVRVLNHPKYYNVTKIVRQSLQGFPQSSPDDEYLAFRGRYRSARGGDIHSFIETVYKGETSRILINEDKHLQGLRREYDSLPLFEREQYDQLERALHSYNYYKDVVNSLRDMEVHRRKSGDVNYQSLYKGIESGLQFLLNNVSGYYIAAQNQWNVFLQEVRGGVQGTNHDISAEKDELKKLVAIFDEADTTYAGFLYRSVGTQTNLIETFVPDIERKQVQFGQEFYDGAREHCASDGFDSDLCRSGAEIRVIEVNPREGDPGVMVPYHSEEAVVERLGIPRNKPLINILGGVRKTTAEDGGANDLFAQAVMRAAHAHQANVGVPGTQAGIGLLFGKNYLKYAEATEHLPDKNKAHFFSVNPGGNTYYPGNPFLEGTPKEEVFALSPVPSIIPPFKAGWELTGRKRFDSPYHLHVAYMEAVYGRVSKPDERLMVVGNGGLYTLFEVNAAIEHDFKLFLVRDTGRFADVAALVSSRMQQGDFNPRVLTEEEFARRIIEQVRQRLPEDVAEEFLKKDFGFEGSPENEDYEVYRHYFRKYMMRVGTGYYTEIRSLKLEDLEEELTSYFSPAERNYRAHRKPYEEI